MANVRIVSHSNEIFRDRVEAGQLLGNELRYLPDSATVVLGIPRGGLVVARNLARVLQARLDMVLSRKLGAPGNPELAIGAIAEDGRLFLHDRVIEHLEVSDSYIKQERVHQLAEIRRRSQAIREIMPRLSLEGKLVIVTDDGVATGATMQAALWTARHEHPQKLVAALPVGPEETIRQLARYTDETICLRAPTSFSAVGQFYRFFQQVEDNEMMAVIREEQERRKIEGTGT